MQYSAIEPAPRYRESGVKSSPRQDALQALSAVVTRELGFKMVTVQSMVRATIELSSSISCQGIWKISLPRVVSLLRSLAHQTSDLWLKLYTRTSSARRATFFIRSNAGSPTSIQVSSLLSNDIYSISYFLGVLSYALGCIGAVHNNSRALPLQGLR